MRSGLAPAAKRLTSTSGSSEPPRRLAARFAAKEAISKALGTGMVGVWWTEMEVLGDRRGKPRVQLYGRALARAQELGLAEWAVSLSHTRDSAVAVVVAREG